VFHSSAGCHQASVRPSCDKYLVFPPAGPVHLFLSKYGAKLTVRELIQNIPSINNANYF
jgi:hypothetical protein